MFSMFIMFNMHVRVCVHMTPPHTPISTPTPIPQGDGPPESVKIQ